MISSQRLLLLFMLINLIIGIGLGIHNNPTSFNYDDINEETNLNEERQAELQEEDARYGGIPTTDTSGEGKTIGNALKMGSLIWDVFIGALNPWSINPNMFHTTVEQIIATLLIFFRSLGSILVGIEIYLFFKNKKAT